jgi:hypothetical protein
MDSHSPGFIGGRPLQTGEISDEEKARLAMHQGYLMGGYFARPPFFHHSGS